MSERLLRNCRIGKDVALALVVGLVLSMEWGWGVEVPHRSVATNRMAEEPEYVREMAGQWDGWDIGWQLRSRYESRWHDYSRPDLVSDQALVTRQLLYMGVKKVVDPIRAVIELEDARSDFNELASTANVENHHEVLQAYGQYYLEDGLAGMPVSMSVGRMTLDWADRRLMSRNRNRNIIRAFDGVRLDWGDQRAEWELEMVAVHPVERSIEDLDETMDEVKVMGVVGYWRGWAPRCALEPYWLWVEQDAERISNRKDLHTVGVHGYGVWGAGSEWDYDCSVAGQWGESQQLEHRAWAVHAELGRTWERLGGARFAFWFNYASGDRHAEDGVYQRFDPLFGAAYSFYGYSNYFSWQNTIHPAVHFQVSPSKKVKGEIIHRAVWLASRTDAWQRGGERDEEGRSGDFIGQETDVRVVWHVHPRFDIDLAYAHFWPGGYVQSITGGPSGDYLQVAGILKF